jgi:hypothetical protein
MGTILCCTVSVRCMFELDAVLDCQESHAHACVLSGVPCFGIRGTVCWVAAG